MAGGTSSWLSGIDTEEKQLQAIGDLYEIVKAQPQFKDLKEPVWPASTPPYVVIEWLIRKLAPLAKGDDWEIDTYKDGRKTRYRFVVYRKYSHYDVKRYYEHIRLCFLPHLAIRDIELHDILVMMFALLSKHNYIPLWDEDGDYSHYLDYKEAHSIYTGEGIAAKYLALIRRVQAESGYYDLYRAVNGYKAKSHRQSQIVWKVDYALRVIESEVTMAPHVYHSNLHPIADESLRYKFIWNDTDDPISNSGEKRFRNRWDPREKYGPICWKETKPGDVHVNPVTETLLPPLCKLMNYLGAHFASHKEYYYKKTEIKNKVLLSEILAAKVTVEELQNNTLIRV